ncbi:hypothetical protein QBC41DRAFT_40897, partial [Cercophora samala]
LLFSHFPTRPATFSRHHHNLPPYDRPTINAYPNDRARQFSFFLQVPDACDSKPQGTEPRYRSAR